MVGGGGVPRETPGNAPMSIRNGNDTEGKLLILSRSADCLLTHRGQEVPNGIKIVYSSLQLLGPPGQFYIPDFQSQHLPRGVYPVTVIVALHRAKEPASLLYCKFQQIGK